MLERLADEIPRFFTEPNMIFLLRALVLTFVLSSVGVSIGFCAGFLISCLRRIPGRAWILLRAPLILFVEYFRRVPFLIVLFIVFFLVQGAKLNIGLFGVALISVCLMSTAFISEIVRAGFDSVHTNQWDTAAAMNMGLARTLAYVVVPQAWKVVLPPAFSFFIGFIKDTSLASAIAVPELTFAGKVFNNEGFSAGLAFGTILILYYVLSDLLARFGSWLETRLANPGASRKATQPRWGTARV